VDRGAHVAFSALLGLVAAKLVAHDILYWYVGLLAGILAGLVPDADLRWKHRMLLHNIFVAIGLAFAAFFAGHFVSSTLSVILGVSSLLGFLGHILLDSLTVRGVALLYPVKHKRYRLAKLRSSSRVANALIEAFSILLIIVVLYA
jgi:inner membrane protein